MVDWDAAGPGRLPLIDLLHLRHMNEHRPADLDWGPTLVEHLLPWARAGGDDPARDYCRRVGIEPTPGTPGSARRGVLARAARLSARHLRRPR